MKQSPLCIIVTRPDPSGTELCQHIQALGDVAIHFPVIAFAPAPDQVTFASTIKKLSEQDWLIFISPQAVRASVPAIRHAWPILPETVRFAAVGAGTAKALKQAGYRLSCVPDQEWSTEGLLQMPEFKAMQSKQVAIIRGVGGREFLEEKLVEKGANVISLIAYQRSLPTVDFSSYLPLLNDQKIDAIICSSFEGVSNLMQLVGEQGNVALKQTPLIVVSERIKALAYHAGFQTIWVASNASHQAILAVITEKRKELCQSRQTNL